MVYVRDSRELLPISYKPSTIDPEKIKGLHKTTQKRVRKTVGVQSLVSETVGVVNEMFSSDASGEIEYPESGVPATDLEKWQKNL